MSVAILRQGSFLIASIQDDLTDREVLELRDTLSDPNPDVRERGVNGLKAAMRRSSVLRRCCSCPAWSEKT